MNKIIVASISIFLLLGCGPKPAPIFSDGEFVLSALNGQRGQIIQVDCWSGWLACVYDVRFDAPSDSLAPRRLTVVQHMEANELLKVH